MQASAYRIDRLSAPEKELLQTLAVVGREFTLKLAQRVTLKSDDKVERMLGQLQLGEFIYEQTAVGEVEYTFKHALTQEVAYKSLLSDHRAALHERTARAIEELYVHQLEDHYSELARHYLRGNDAGKAIRYAQLAAEQAINRAAYAEAASMLDAALKLLDKLPDGAERLRPELALRSIESTVAFVLYGSSSREREGAIKRICELSEQLGERDQLLRGLILLSRLTSRKASCHGLELSRRWVALAEHTSDAGCCGRSRYRRTAGPILREVARGSFELCGRYASLR